MAIRINITDLIGATGAGSAEQKTALRDALGTGGISDEQIEALVSDTDLDPERTLAYVFGTDGTDWGRQAISGAIMTMPAQGSFLLRSTSGSGAWEVGTTEQALALLDLADTGKGEVGAAVTALATDATAGITLGSDALAAILKAFTDNAATVRATFDSLGVPYFTSQWSEGQNVVASADATAEVEGVAGIDLAAISSPSAVSSVSNVLPIDWAAGTKFRTHTTTQNTTIASSNLQTYEAARLIVTGGGAHTITFPSGARVSDGFDSGLTVASGEKYVLIFMYDGTDLLISVSTEFVEVA